MGWVGGGCFSALSDAKITRCRDKYLYYFGKTQRTSSRLMTSIWSFLWKSSHSSLYLSISSLVWRIFFFSTSNSEPCCMVVMVTWRDKIRETRRPENRALTPPPSSVSTGGNGKTGNGVVGHTYTNDFWSDTRRERSRLSGKIGRTTAAVSRHAFVAVTDGRITHTDHKHTRKRTLSHWHWAQPRTVTTTANIFTLVTCNDVRLRGRTAEATHTHTLSRRSSVTSNHYNV